MNLTSILPEYIDTFWPMAAELLEPAVEMSGGRYDIESVEYLVKNGFNQLWVMYDDDDKIRIAFTTAIENYPRRRMLAITFLGGDDFVNNIGIVDDTLSEWAIAHGCDGAEIMGRKGWERALSPFGFKASYVTVEKEF